MVSKKAVILNESGFHIRPAQLFVEKASEFKSDIEVKSEDGIEADGKSILGLMTMGLVKGSKIIIQAIGDDEAAAIDALVELIDSKFGEE